ncbi:MAG TPA: PHB depolymerase family esterase [Gemmatimonadales bacterium]
MDLPPPALDTATFTEHVVETGLGRRRYRLFVPGRTDGGDPLPLLVVLHGCTQDAADIARGTRFNQHAERQGMLVLYPEQPIEANPQKCWNWFLPAHQGRDSGEPALVAYLTRRVMAEYPVDSGRIYLVGVSAGGAMAVLTAIAYPEIYTALGVHSGIGYRAAENLASALTAMKGEGSPPGELAREAHAAMGDRARAVPIMVVQGQLDPAVNAGNAQRISEQFVTLAVMAGSGPAPPETDGFTSGGREVTRTVWLTADGPALVEQWIIEGLAHAWSGGSPDGTWTDPAGPDASAEMIRFLLSHRLQGPSKR